MINRLLVFWLLASCLCSASAQDTLTPPGDVILWRAPRSMTRLDWVWGPGGEERAPVPPFRFVRENLGGTNPKIDVRDAHGASWTVKFGGEVHTDVFTSRLLFAAGYAAEPTYYVAEGVVTGVTGIRRAKPYIAKDGRFHNARFKLRDRGLEYADEYRWSWVVSPFQGSRELNGLRILMMLLSNWDAKDARDAGGSNTAVFRRSDAHPPAYIYAITDWGSSLGSWGGFFRRTRWDASAYERQTPQFVKGVKNGCIVWGYGGKHGRDVSSGISPEDARWLLAYVSSITAEDLESGLAASGAAANDARRFSRAIRERIDQLQETADRALTSFALLRDGLLPPRGCDGRAPGQSPRRGPQRLE